MMAKKIIEPAEANVELAKRKLARMRLADFGQYVYPWWVPAEMHAFVCQELEEVFRYIESGGTEGTQALIVQVEPQTGKSTMVSRLFPAWALGKRPDTNVMLATYAADFSADHSKAVRDIITGERYAAIFGEKSDALQPVELSGDSFAKGNWSLNEPHRGGMLAIGVEGGATGRPAQLIIIDDPFKNREEANSPAQRKRVKKWFTSSIFSRLTKDTALVLIHTRWHREDLIGEMLKAMVREPGAIQWRIVDLPAFPLEVDEYALDEGEQRKAMLGGLYKPLRDLLGRAPGSKTALWPEKHPREMLEQLYMTLKAAGELGDWYALYQQQPRPSEGVFFSESMFEIKKPSEVPEGLIWCGYMDLAMGESARSDWNACAPEAFDAQENLWIRDMVRIHDIDSFLETMLDVMTSRTEAGTVWGVETVAFSKLVFKDFMKNPKLRGVVIEERTPDKDKVSRARPVRSKGLAKKIFLVDGPWVQEFLLEMLDFPSGQHDDQVDTVSGGFEMATDELVLREGALMA